MRGSGRLEVPDGQSRAAVPAACIPLTSGAGRAPSNTNRPRIVDRRQRRQRDVGRCPRRPRRSPRWTTCDWRTRRPPPRATARSSRDQQVAARRDAGEREAAVSVRARVAGSASTPAVSPMRTMSTIGCERRRDHRRDARDRRQRHVLELHVDAAALFAGADGDPRGARDIRRARMIDRRQDRAARARRRRARIVRTSGVARPASCCGDCAATT